MIFLTLTLLILIGLTTLAMKFWKDAPKILEYATKFRNKLMWNSLYRTLLTGHLGYSVKSLVFFRDFDGESGQATFTAVVLLAVSLVFPVLMLR